MIKSFQRGTQSSVELRGNVTVGELLRYQHVRAEGRYEPERQVLLDNMPSQAGFPGFRVLTPFRREGSERLLLVDRGWVPLGATRQDLPPVFVSPNSAPCPVAWISCPLRACASVTQASPATPTGHAC